MEIELLVARVGVAGAQNRGEVITVPDDEGKRMIAAGQAAMIVERKKPKAEKTIKHSNVEKTSKY